MARPPYFSNNLQFRYYPAQSIYQRPGQAIFSKSRPMAVLSTPGPMAVLSMGNFINARPNGCFIKAETTDGQTCRFQPQIAISLLSRAINLSAAGPSYFQQKPAQWPFHQRQAQWPFYQGRSNRMARPLDFSNNLQCRYIPHNQAGPS